MYMPSAGFEPKLCARINWVGLVMVFTGWWTVP